MSTFDRMISSDLKRSLKDQLDKKTVRLNLTSAFFDVVEELSGERHVAFNVVWALGGTKTMPCTNFVLSEKNSAYDSTVNGIKTLQDIALPHQAEGIMMAKLTWSVETGKRSSVIMERVIQLQPGAVITMDKGFIFKDLDVLSCFGASMAKIKIFRDKVSLVSSVSPISRYGKKVMRVLQ